MPELPTLYQDQIHKTKYARWREEDNRRETWSETVDRYLDFMAAQAQELGWLLASGIDTELREAILALDIMPSMRSMMTAGNALDRDNVAGYNPVSGDTLVLTRERGLVPIATLAGHVASVLNIAGRWAHAEFRGYGEQQTSEVHLRLNSNSRKIVKATANHRWVLEDGRVVPTEDLKEGDRIPFVAAERPETDSLDYRLGVIHGLVYGDGTATHVQERLKGYHIRLCGDHADLLPYLSGHPVTYPPSANGDPVVMLYGAFAKTHSLKQLPWEGETDEYLIGFVRGWLAADGSVSANSQVTLCVKDEGREFFDRVASRLGYVVQRVAELPARTNYGVRKAPALNLYLSRSSMVAEDFLITRKRANFRPLCSHFVVTDVKIGPKTAVYCAEVSDTNTFVLDHGLVTGNCAYLAINRPQAFDEALYILCCGTGVGFSVERQYVNQLPEVPTLYPSDTTIVVRDSKIGWASALRQLIHLLYSGVIPQWDTSKVRPAGARLKTFGGRASGPGPLVELFEYVVDTFKAAQGRKLTSIECHGVMCKVGDIVVVGGVRRSALISLSNPSDDRMRDAKTGDFRKSHPEYELANNSAVWTEKPSMERFLDEWIALIKSKAGERGIINRAGMQRQAAANGRRDPDHDFGTNPCSEIILRDRQFCNLSEVVVRPQDSLEDLKRKVRLATILGTLQSTFTDFRYLSPQWKRNCEEERLLGVSLTGIMDHPILAQQYFLLDKEWWGGVEVNWGDPLPDTLDFLRQVAIDTNAEWAEKLGINPATAITCVKPSGTVSQLVNAASGIHARHSHFYIRTNRAIKNDPVAQFLYFQGIPAEDAIGKEDTTWVFSFPIKAPKGAITRHDVSALDQLRLWLVYAEHWCEHKPSITVYVREEEWLEVGAFVHKHFDRMSGVSFLPHSDPNYKQLPYQDINEEEYERLAAEMPASLDWSLLSVYETEDSTEGVRELACSAAGGCEIA